ncbi:MAG TPA: hydroxymethylglutaryl-CoA reductase, degradative [Bacteroidales bacterium]|nr:hydroxymethylglutaryl-CoA reductase, degradative [Bacteroidales bacterium]
MSNTVINGFSKLSREGKIRVLEQQTGSKGLASEFESFQHPVQQPVFDSFSENVVSNFHLPYSIAPNFLINGKLYHVPLVTEESSVVAAAASAAKFWGSNCGFNARVVSTLKSGQVHFLWTGKKEVLVNAFPDIKEKLIAQTAPITENMEQRGGGITDILLEDYTGELLNYYRINVRFETVDSMGANFINTVLEAMASSLKSFLSEQFSNAGECDIIMSILSNYTPECFVECHVEAPVARFEQLEAGVSAEAFVDKFITAVRIAEFDVFRAVTHNKGIMNGVDALLLATGNDSRAVEAGVHAFASRNGSYSSLSKVYVYRDTFHFSVTLPISIGTVGGVTSLHPLAKRSLEMLGHPSAQELMMILASVGLASNFAAIRALVTRGIQRGHMKMHLGNILSQLGATDEQRIKATEWFADKTVSVAAVREFINNH